MTTRFNRIGIPTKNDHTTTNPKLGFTSTPRSKSGNTASRPTGASVGSLYYDTTIHKPVWYDGTNWRDGAGSIV